MAMTQEDIELHIREAFPDAKIELMDTAGDGDHYQLTVTCESFRGKSLIAQHQMVYTALKGHMGKALHALALKTIVPTA